MRLDEKEAALALAGLRYLQWTWKSGKPVPEDIYNIFRGTGNPAISRIVEIDALCEKINCGPDESGSEVLRAALEWISRAANTSMTQADIHRIAEAALTKYDNLDEIKEPKTRVFIESDEHGREYFDADLDDLIGQLDRLGDDAKTQTDQDGITRRVGWEIE